MSSWNFLFKFCSRSYFQSLFLHSLRLTYKKTSWRNFARARSFFCAYRRVTFPWPRFAPRNDALPPPGVCAPLATFPWLVIASAEKCRKLRTFFLSPARLVKTSTRRGFSLICVSASHPEGGEPRVRGAVYSPRLGCASICSDSEEAGSADLWKVSTSLAVGIAKIRDDWVFLKNRFFHVLVCFCRVQGLLEEILCNCDNFWVGLWRKCSAFYGFLEVRVFLW